jgi:magnesium chelatase accessory protein
MTGALDWARDGRDWPNRTASRFAAADGMRWHVQVMGAGPVLLLLHGTGASTHSWRGLAPLLARRFTVVAPDLPGHGFTETPPRGGLKLPAMTRGVAQLLKALPLTPEFVVGHSAGAAIGLRMTLDGDVAARGVVSINGALLPFPGVAAIAFPAMARALFLNPFAAPFITRMARDPAAVERLIRGTGSTLDAAGYEFYHRLLSSERHVAATIGMMAGWDLEPLKRDLARLHVPLTLIAADRDKAVPPNVAREVAAMTRTARVETLPGVGHLAHEEAPEAIAALIERALLPTAAAPRKRKAG